MDRRSRSPRPQAPVPRRGSCRNFRTWPGGRLAPLRFPLAITESLAWAAVAALQIAGWPGQWTTRIPIGTESSATVPLFNAWTLRWNAEQAMSGFGSYFHAPIFFPTPGTFTFSEMQPTMLVVAPLLAGGFSWALAYNLYLALNLGLAAVFARRIALGLGYPPGLAFLAALLVFHLPFARWQLGVIQLTALWGPLAVIAAAVAWARRPGIRTGVLLGVAVAACYAACHYYGLFVLLLAPCFVLLLPGDLRAVWRRRAGSLAVAGGVALLLVAPLVIGQGRYLASSASPRSPEWVRQFAARGSDYLTAFPGRGVPAGTRPLGSGVVLSLTAIAGAAGMAWGRVWRRRPQGPRFRRRWLRFCVAMAAASLILSCGPRLSLAGLEPWTWLRDRVPPVGWIRVPYRLAAFHQLAVVFLAVGTLDRCCRWYRRRGSGAVRAPRVAGQPTTIRRVRRVLHLALFGLPWVLTAAAVWETWPIPTATRDVRPLVSEPAWSAWLRGHAPRGVAAAWVPFPQTGTTAAYEPTTIGMLRSLDFGLPLVNGYSGFFPDDYRRLRVAMRRFPDGPTLQALRARGVRYLIADPAAGDVSWTTRATRQRPSALRFADPVTGVTIWDVEDFASIRW